MDLLLMLYFGRFLTRTSGYETIYLHIFFNPYGVELL